MLQILKLPPDLQQRVRTSERPITYDAMMKIAHLTDPIEQSALLDAAMRGESTSTIREKARAMHKRSGSASDRPHRTERLQESLNGYTVIVSGPVGPDATRHMRAAVQALLERLEAGMN